MVFSIMLWMPSWGGMINGLMTLNGAWDKVRTDPIIRMMVMALAFYGMSTFEGPMLSIKSVNSLSHYTDWTIGHVHSGALGWNGMITFAAVYFLVPRLWKRERLYSPAHGQLALLARDVGIVFYAASMWVAGITQGLMWREYGADGYLVNSFVDTVAALHPMYLMRALRRRCCTSPAPSSWSYNVWMTIAGKLRERGADDATPLRRAGGPSDPCHSAECRPDRPRRRAKVRTPIKSPPMSVDRRPQEAGTQRHPAGRLRLRRGGDRRHRGDRPAVLDRQHDRESGGHAPLHPARAGRARHLRARRLLYLPQPDDPPVPRRGGTLWPLQPGGGKHVRPPVPVGIEAHRAGPGARRRALFGRMARPAPEEPASVVPRKHHAAIQLPRRNRPGCAPIPTANADGAARRRRALYRQTTSTRPRPT